MTKSCAIVLAPLALVCAALLGACDLPGSSSSTTTTGNNTGTNSGDNGSNSGGTFTGSDLNGTWTSGCISFTGAVTGETYYQNMLQLSGGNAWTLQQTTYSDACQAGQQVVIYTLGGSFTVGSVVSGSMQSLQFTVSSDATAAQPVTSAATSFFNTYGSAGLTEGVNGSIWNVTSLTGGHTVFYPNADGNDTVYNVATFSGNTLTLGAGVETVPGVYSSGSTPTSVTISYSK